MKLSLLLVAVSATAFLAAELRAQTEPAPSPAAPDTAVAAATPAPAPAKLVYKAPAGAGKIPTRVSGGARGSSTDTSVLALVPDHAALTTRSQPSLFWFQSKPAKARLEVTLVEPKKAKPLLALTSEVAKKGGIQRLKLADHKVELQLGVTYEWSIAIVPDAENRSQDVIAKGTIKRVAPPADLAQNIDSMEPLDRAAAYAQAGIWYDALEAVSNAIDANPADASLRAQRAALLQQVGLGQATAAEKK